MKTKIGLIVNVTYFDLLVLELPGTKELPMLDFIHSKQIWSFSRTEKEPSFLFSWKYDGIIFVVQVWYDIDIVSPFDFFCSRSATK